MSTESQAYIALVEIEAILERPSSRTKRSNDAHILRLYYYAEGDNVIWLLYVTLRESWIK